MCAKDAFAGLLQGVRGGGPRRGTIRRTRLPFILALITGRQTLNGGMGGRTIAKDDARRAEGGFEARVQYSKHDANRRAH